MSIRFLFHTCTALLGICILFYESQYNLEILHQFSGWFLLVSTITHFHASNVPVSNVFVYPVVCIGIVFVLPVGFNLIQTARGRHFMLDAVGLHVAFPLLNVLCIQLNKSVALWKSFRVSVLYSTAYACYIELLQYPFPYATLNEAKVFERFLMYAGNILVQIISIVVLHNIVSFTRKRLAIQ